MVETYSDTALVTAVTTMLEQPTQPDATGTEPAPPEMHAALQAANDLADSLSADLADVRQAITAAKRSNSVDIVTLIAQSAEIRSKLYHARVAAIEAEQAILDFRFFSLLTALGDANEKGSVALLVLESAQKAAQDATERLNVVSNAVNVNRATHKLLAEYREQMCKLFEGGGVK